MVLNRTRQRAWTGKIKKMAEEALRGLGYADCELSVVLLGDEGIRELNREYRGIDRPTDVLSFPMDDEYMLGDIVISLETAASRAGPEGTRMDDEVAGLLVHGLLHLLGYDHVRGGRQAAKMRKKEDELLGLVRANGCRGSCGDGHG